jgi:hypothetical protein
MLKARLHPIWVPTVGYRYSVIFRGKLSSNVHAIPKVTRRVH